MEEEAETADVLKCRLSLNAFVAGAFVVVNPGTPFKWNWHIDCICEYLESAYRGENRRLIFNMPPRELKSFIISICYPAWVLGNKPHEKFIVSSHSLRPLSAKLSADTSRLMRSDWYKTIFPNTILEKDTEFELRTTQNGGRLATAQTGVVGSGGNYLILDDPNKPDEALSDGIRNGTNEWIDNTYMSRMDDRTTGRVILVQQRVHENDVTGHLFAKGGYTLVKLPAEANRPISIEINGKIYTMREHELLHKARLPAEELASLRIDLGDYSYAGQYLQEPVPPGGGMFRTEWIKYFDIEKFNFRNANGFILCDPAGVGQGVTTNAKRKKSDWTAFMVVATSDDQNYYCVDIVRDKFNPTERIDALVNLHREWSAIFGKPLKVGYESYGLQSDLHYIEQRQEDESYRFPLIPLGGRMSKADRIARLIPDMQNGRWYFPHKIMYKDSSNRTFELVSEMIKGEMLTFPVSKHDDCCFVGETLIATNKGNIPIRDIKIGDMVLTPSGFHPVIDCGFTGVKNVVMRLGIIGTPDHPVFTVNKGYTILDTITCINEVIGLNICDLLKTALLRALSSMASNTIEWEESVTTIYQQAIPTKDVKILKDCMSLYGSFIQERQFQKAMIFTTRIMTHSISILKTLSVYRKNCIVQCMAGYAQKLKEKILMLLGISLFNGTSHLKAALGISSTLLEQPLKYSLAESILALNVKRNSFQKNPGLSNIVPIYAENAPDQELIHAKINAKSNVNIAEKIIWRKPLKQNIAQKHALTSIVGHQDKLPVFNLTVDNAKCFFANGILVHNCDALSRIYDEEMFARFPAPRGRVDLVGNEISQVDSGHWINA